jgi:hypothetical protein
VRRRPPARPAAALIALLLAAGLAACGGGAGDGEPPAPAEEGATVAASVGDAPAGGTEGEGRAGESEGEEDEGEAAEGEGEPEEGDGAKDEPSFLSEQNRRDVSLYFQDPDSDLLVAEPREIFETNSLTDQAKQIVVGLIDGPRNEDLLPTVPSSTRVLGLYMDRNGTAWVDLSHEVVSDHLGGTAEELATIFSIVNSLTVNLPQIKRVHILVDGDERDTLKDHLDLGRDFVQDLSIVRGTGG